MDTQQKTNLQEYAELSQAIHHLESELALEQEVQTQLRQRIDACYEQLKNEFAKRWPPLQIRQV